MIDSPDESTQLNEPINIPERKADHIRINLEKDVSSTLTTGLENYHFEHQALPELDMCEISLKQNLFGKTLNAPILISSMTGGTDEALEINQILAEAAQETRIAMGVGSQRAALENPDLSVGYQVRKFAPDILLFANLGAVQLNYGYTPVHCQRAVDMIEADALILHLNSIQEALQPDGNTRFKGLLKKIEEVCKTLPVPVIVKEVGWGISEDTARRLADAGAAGIDVAGSGGTSWSQVEMFREKDPYRAKVASAFRGWGLPTAETIQQTKKGAPGVKIIASGGIRNGVEIAKCIALGASLVGSAGPFLKTAKNSLLETLQLLDQYILEIRISMFGAGCENLEQLSKVKLIYRS